MQYKVRALSNDNLISELTVDAHDEADARRQIEARGLFAADMAPVRKSFATLRPKASG